MVLDQEKCPWCGSQITREKFARIEARIRTEEKEKLEKTRIELSKQFEIKQQAIEKQYRERTEKQVSEINQKLTASNSEIDKLKRSNAEFEKQAVKEAEVKANAKLADEMRGMRSVLEAENNKKLLAQQAEFKDERASLQGKISELSKQLQKKNAEEVEVSSINLLTELQKAFPEDDISYISVGAPTERLVHKICYKGNICGVILIDTRQRQSWQKAFVTNLRKEQIELVAEHAILSTTVFPKGKKELLIEDGVIVAHPDCTISLIELLRSALIRMHLQGLSVVDRTAKVERLYNFIVSESYVLKRREATKLAEEVLEIDVSESEEHKRVWKKRGTLMTRLKSCLQGIDMEMSEILEEPARVKPSISTTVLPVNKPLQRNL